MTQATAIEPIRVMKGWALTTAVALLLLALSGMQVLIWGAGEDGFRVVVRSTARSSILLFALAFSASSIRALFRTGFSGWLLSNRRYLGVSYAASHLLHALALAVLTQVSTEFTDSVGAVTLLGGGLAYVFTFAMAATSNDVAIRKLGLPLWQRLHWVGGWYIWLIFALTFQPLVFADLGYLPAGLLVVSVPVLRICARVTALR